MPLSSLLQRFRQMAAAGHTAAPEATHVSPSDVEAARVRARRRLIGMVVLVGAGVVGFPWLFETQPRPMSPDVEMVQAHGGIGGGEDGLSVARAAASRAASGKVAVADIVPPPDNRRAEEPKNESQSRRDADTDAGEPRESMSSKPPVAAAARASAERPKAPDKAAVKEPVKPVVAKEPAAKPVPKDVAAKEAASKAVAKPGDKAADKSDNRYVVQFGAFADANAARAVRMKVERLGIKTYAQQVDTPAGKRVRVRIGPFTDKAEADKALATLRKAGLTGSVLTL